MCGNLGLGGDWDPSRELLRRLAGVTPPGGLLIGDSVESCERRSERSRLRGTQSAGGFHWGHVVLRLHYGSLVTPWWHQLNIPPDDLDALVSGTGWTVDARMGDAEGYAVVLCRL
jgi:hypothetical protein